MTKKLVYTEYALGGSVHTLGANLWNQGVQRAIGRNDVRGDDLKAAATVFFEEILPELHNFVEQKIAHQVKQSDLQNDLLTKQRDSARSQADTFLKSLDEERELRKESNRLNGDLQKFIVDIRARVNNIHSLGDIQGCVASLDSWIRSFTDRPKCGLNSINPTNGFCACTESVPCPVHGIAEKPKCLCNGGPAEGCKLHPTEKREAPVPIRKGCICGPEGMCDYHRVTDPTTPRRDLGKCHRCDKPITDACDHSLICNECLREEE